MKYLNVTAVRPRDRRMSVRLNCPLHSELSIAVESNHCAVPGHEFLHVSKFHIIFRLKVMIVHCFSSGAADDALIT